MTERTDEFADFLNEMFWSVQEGAFLFEFPEGATDHTPSGPVQHGPWTPDDCSRCLLTWFDHGWINAYVLSEHLARWRVDDDALLPDPTDDSARMVARDRARAILADSESWTNDRAEGLVVLNPASHAPDSTFRQLWLDAVKPV